MLLHHNAKNVPQNHFFYLSDLFHSNLQEDSLFQAWSNLKDGSIQREIKDEVSYNADIAVQATSTLHKSLQKFEILSF